MKIYTCHTKTKIMTALKHASKLNDIDDLLKDSEESKPTIHNLKRAGSGKYLNDKNIMGSHIEITDKEINELEICLPLMKYYAERALKILGKKTNLNTPKEVE